ncbi:hypothetical protein EYF80_029548 [Liparis tanakae]|uniref:Uncharacterized protein n=1 Tax=Liparis tanakae TaxID=230148 RepID=A0A4Z2H556_9TELE|nr:hypothetical protein EYF80_029548 [Liparis tanakae]
MPAKEILSWTVLILDLQQKRKSSSAEAGLGGRGGAGRCFHVFDPVTPELGQDHLGVRTAFLQDLAQESRRKACQRNHDSQETGE